MSGVSGYYNRPPETISSPKRCMSRKRFSIITPSYNAGCKLEATIQSVLSQKEELFEYIIIDSCSTDGTLNIIRKYAGRVKYLSEPDRGVYDAMNKGIQIARGDYLYFLGAGDLLRNNVLERVDRVIPRHGRNLLYGNVHLMSGERISSGEFNKRKLARGNICHQAIFYQRTVFELIGDYDLRYSLLADYDFNLKCFSQKGIDKIYVGYVIADYEGNGASSHEGPALMNERLSILRKHFGYKHILLMKFKRAIRQ
jgi:glycosyltransferase involved in cell wall biosynthesis